MFLFSFLIFSLFLSIRSQDTITYSDVMNDIGNTGWTIRSQTVSPNEHNLLACPSSVCTKITQFGTIYKTFDFTNAHTISMTVTIVINGFECGGIYCDFGYIYYKCGNIIKNIRTFSPYESGTYTQTYPLSEECNNNNVTIYFHIHTSSDNDVMYIDDFSIFGLQGKNEYISTKELVDYRKLNAFNDLSTWTTSVTLSNDIRFSLDIDYYIRLYNSAMIGLKEFDISQYKSLTVYYDANIGAESPLNSADYSIIVYYSCGTASNGEYIQSITGKSYDGTYHDGSIHDTNKYLTGESFDVIEKCDNLNSLKLYFQIRAASKYVFLSNVYIYGKLITDSPTNVPTLIPTIYPTYIPTTIPTKYPTMTPILPTTSPSLRPTSFPTKNPTYSTLNNPTNNPTKNPTKYPTINPTKIPLNTITYQPTINTNQPTIVTQLILTTIQTTNNIINENSLLFTQSKLFIPIIIGGIITCILFILMLILLYLCQKKKIKLKEKQLSEYNDNTQMITIKHNNHQTSNNNEININTNNNRAPKSNYSESNHKGNESIDFLLGLTPGDTIGGMIITDGNNTPMINVVDDDDDDNAPPPPPVPPIPPISPKNHDIYDKSKKSTIGGVIINNNYIDNDYDDDDNAPDAPPPPIPPVPMEDGFNNNNVTMVGSILNDNDLGSIAKSMTYGNTIGGDMNNVNKEHTPEPPPPPMNFMSEGMGDGNEFNDNENVPPPPVPPIPSGQYSTKGGYYD